MKIRISTCLLVMATAATTATAGTNLSVNVNLGAPVVVAAPAPPPPQQPAPVVTLDVAPRFIMSSELGFHVSVGVPYDIVYIGQDYYLNRDGRWYRSGYYNGPWESVRHKQLPPGLRKRKLEEIRHQRDNEYRRYERDHDRGKWHEPVRHDEGKHHGKQKDGRDDRDHDDNGKHKGHHKD